MADYRKRSQEPELPKQNAEGGSVDLHALADLIANKVSEGIEIPQQNGIMYRGNSPDGTPINTFDDTASMDALAQSMVVQRGDQSSNFEDLGGVKETKKDNNQTNSTIDLLSDLED
jgi:hypothetical protein